MTLTAYKKKRNLKKSGEPKTRIAKPSKKKIFTIHDHRATHHHFDLRLEMNGVLKSWAIPKTPPRTKAIKRLAIQVEDHPLSYAKFKGTIPEPNYGAGTVKIWDNGTYELIDKTKDKIVFELKGKKLKGKYVLVKTKLSKGKGWLFMKI